MASHPRRSNSVRGLNSPIDLIEVKVKIEDREKLLRRLHRLGAQHIETIVQDDIFYICNMGRLKLRRVSPTRGALIFYRRDSNQGPKQSQCVIYHTASPDELRAVLDFGIGSRGCVRKHREIYVFQGSSYI